MFCPPPSPKMSHSVIQNCCWITLHARFTSSMEGKANFSKRPKQLDGFDL